MSYPTSTAEIKQRLAALDSHQSAVFLQKLASATSRNPQSAKLASAKDLLKNPQIRHALIGSGIGALAGAGSNLLAPRDERKKRSLLGDVAGGTLLGGAIGGGGSALYDKLKAPPAAATPKAPAKAAPAADKPAPAAPKAEPKAEPKAAPAPAAKTPKPATAPAAAATKAAPAPASAQAQAPAPTPAATPTASPAAASQPAKEEEKRRGFFSLVGGGLGAGAGYALDKNFDPDNYLAYKPNAYEYASSMLPNGRHDKLVQPVGDMLNRFGKLRAKGKGVLPTIGGLAGGLMLGMGGK